MIHKNWLLTRLISHLSLYYDALAEEENSGEVQQSRNHMLNGVSSPEILL